MLVKEKIYSEGIFIKKNYPNGQLAVFFSNSDGEPVAELSLNDNSVELASDEFILKNYSENSLIAQEFLDSKAFTPTDRYLLMGAHLCPICRINI